MTSISILNDVLGPVMRGPSSSHTAGAYRIGRVAQMLVDAPAQRIRISFDPQGSYAATCQAMGVDAAFAAAFLGWQMTDDRYPQAAETIAARGMELCFAVEPLEDNTHPNTVRLAVVTQDGGTHVVWARSIGGGMVDVYRCDEGECRIDGKSYVLLVRAESACAAEVCRGVTEQLSAASGAACQVALQPAHEHSGTVLAQWNCCEPVSPELRQALRSRRGVLDVRYVLPLMYVPKEPSPFTSAREMLALAAGKDCSLGKTGCAYESCVLGIPEEDVVAEMLRRYEVMRAAVARGLDDSRVSMPLLPPAAARLWRAEQEGRLAHGGMLARAVARGLAALHVCNSQGVVCAAPTGGSSGVLPGVLVTLADERKLTGQHLARALFAAGAVGLVVAQRATFAAEEAGCQVEIGVAGAMAAAAVVELAGGAAGQAAGAASIALQNTMGMVCDPVGGGCEIPCHTRTAAAIAQAFVCADLVLSGYVNPISLDDAVDASYAAGRALPPELRCTALGGVAATPSAKALVERCARHRGSANRP